MIPNPEGYFGAEGAPGSPGGGISSSEVAANAANFRLCRRVITGFTTAGAPSASE